MRVVHLSAYDRVGGAARSAYRLHRALRESGVDSWMLVRSRATDDTSVVEPSTAYARGYGLMRAFADAAIPKLLHPEKPPRNFGGALLPERVARSIASLAPDVVHVHWIGEGFVRPETLSRIRIPLVWTLHDSWAFTGGCHLPGTCTRFGERCGACPALASRRERDLSRRVWNRKSRAWRDLDLTLVAPSRWMAERARASALFRTRHVEIVRNALDTSLFHPVSRHVAREVLRLPADGAFVLLAGVGAATDTNKGLAILVEALREVARSRPDVRLLVAGSSQGVEAGPVPVHALGLLADEMSMVLAHCAADVVAIPSREENLPNVALEALACGRPVAAFRVGGIPEIVEDLQTGALAQPQDASDLARAVAWILEDPARWEHLSSSARRAAVAEYASARIAERHARIYGEVLARARRRPGAAA